MRQIIDEYRTFWRESVASYRSTGAVAPSGRFLARAIAAPLKSRNGRPRRVLEVGPGTGALTSEIVRHIGPADEFDIVELNPQFVASLERRFQRDALFRRVAARTRILHLPVQEHEADRPYDFIVSGLPLNNFPVELVREIFDSFHRLVAPGGVLSYFEYLWIRDMKRLFVKGDERRRLLKIGSVLERYLDLFEFRRDTVWVNMPPALVHHLRLNGNGSNRS